MAVVFRKIAVTVWLMLMTIAVCWMFWHTELVYSTPTPVPVAYHEVKTGSVIHLPKALQSNSDKPRLVHFFNPDCPCSRFNMTHFNSLVAKYKDQMDFSVVVLTDENYSENEITDKFDITVPVSFDASIADTCGVISTPQAVILNTDSTLFYRGNYNKSRYCTDARSDYARIAIDSLLASRKANLEKSAHVAYGCSLPGTSTCKKPKA